MGIEFAIAQIYWCGVKFKISSEKIHSIIFLFYE